MEYVPIISAIIAFGALIVSSVAVVISKQNARVQGQLTERLRSQDQDFERKRFITALWDKMTEVAEIHPDAKGKYDEPDIFYALNTLELVSICWSDNIVDRRMIFLVFGDSFRSRVQEILTITSPLPTLRRAGTELLHQRQIILNVNKEIEDMAAKQVKLLQGG